MRISIENAPFTTGQKREIKAMGFIGFELGELNVILKDPVAHFRAIKNKMNPLPEQEVPASLEKKIKVSFIIPGDE